MSKALAKSEALQDALEGKLQEEAEQELYRILEDSAHGVAGKVAFFYIAKKYFVDRKTGQPRPTWLMDMLAYGAICNRMELDPMSGDLSVVYYRNKYTNAYEPTFIATIDAVRKVAHRSGKYAGMDEPKVEVSDNGTPIKATCTIYIQQGNDRVPVTKTVYWDEFKGTSDFWKRMPKHMLAKVAESQALRAAFSEDLSGVYTAEEMEGSNTLNLPSREKGKKPEKLSMGAADKVLSGEATGSPVSDEKESEGTPDQDTPSNEQEGTAEELSDEEKAEIIEQETEGSHE